MILNGEIKMKKNPIYIITIFILISSNILITSCEEVIEIDLNSSDPQIVIEGIVTDQPGPYTIEITKTTDYYNPGEYPTVSGAIVTISDGTGNFEILTETESGIYQADSLQGYPGRTYSLSVEIDSEIYEASSKMPVALEIDRLDTRYVQAAIGDDGRYDLICNFRDTPGIEDYCRLKVYKNDEEESGYFLYNGRLSDGNLVRYDRFHIEEIEENDMLRVDLLTIDKDVYEYYSTLNDVLATDPRGLGSTDVPANPNSNISGDALGYFGAYTIRTDSIIVRKKKE